MSAFALSGVALCGSALMALAAAWPGSTGTGTGASGADVGLGSSAPVPERRGGEEIAFGFGSDCELPALEPNGLVAEGSAIFVEPFFASYTATKEYRICIDPSCTIEDQDPESSGEPCDPFPDDGHYTYLYRLTNDAGSNNSLIGFIIDSNIPGAVIEAGFLPGGGVEPSDVLVTGSGGQAQWQFFDDTVDPGEMTVWLYIISGLGPGEVDATVLGDFGLDAPGTCPGPAVDCGDCNENGIPDVCETLPEYDPETAMAADHCEDAEFICPGIIYMGSNVGAERDTITWCGLIYGGEFDVFYAYRPVADAPNVVARACESTMPLVISAHSDCPATEENQIACNFASAVGTNCGIIFPVERGETYYIRIAGAGNATGEFELELFGPPCLLNPNDTNNNGVPDDCDCLADVNNDGVVNGADFNQVFFAIGDCENSCPEDIDQDGDVDINDALLVNESLGPCPFKNNKVSVLATPDWTPVTIRQPIFVPPTTLGVED